MADTRHSKKGTRGAIGEREVGRGWREDVGDVVVQGKGKVDPMESI